MPAIVTLLEPLACWMPSSLSTISAVTLVSSPVAVLIPEILKLLPSVSVFISLPALSFTKNLPFASLPTVYSFVLGVSFGSFMVTVNLSPLTAFLGSLIVTVVLLRSWSLIACSLVIVLAPPASSKITSGAFTYSKLAEASTGAIGVFLFGFM